MKVLEWLTLSFQSLRHTLPQLVRLGLWLWVVPLAAAELAVVGLLWNATHPAVSWLVAPWLARLTGDDTLHYPRTFELLPALFRHADVPLGVIFGAIGIGAATPAFAARFEGRPVAARAALGEAFRRAPALIAVLLPLHLVPYLLTGVLGDALGRRGGLVARVAPLLVIGGALVVQAAWFYAASLVMLERRPVLAALRALPSTWGVGFGPALLVSTATLVILVPLQVPGVTPTLLVERGTPELVGVLTLIHVAAGWINAFVLTGTATLLYLSVVRPRGARS